MISLLPHVVFMHFLSHVYLLVFLKDTDHVLCETATEVYEIYMNFNVWAQAVLIPGPLHVGL
jgi:hypothetical protein